MSSNKKFSKSLQVRFDVVDFFATLCDPWKGRKFIIERWADDTFMFSRDRREIETVLPNHTVYHHKQQIFKRRNMVMIFV